MMLIAATALTVASLMTHTDTTVSVRQGTVLNVSNFGGSVAISAWPKNMVHIAADHGRRTSIDVDSDENVLKVSSNGYRGAPGAVDFQIEVPVWMSISVDGPFTDVQVEGTRGPIRVDTVKGEVAVVGGVGPINLTSVEGAITLEKANGRVKVSSINEGVTLSNVIGDITAETVNGDVILNRVDSDAIDVSSVGGDLMYSGALKRAGQYRFQTHDGDIQLLVPDKTGAFVAVSTFSGDFETSWPIKLNQVQRHRQFQFTLGTGGAQLDLESFSGDIQLRSGTGDFLNFEGFKDLEGVKDLKNLKSLKELKEVERLKAEERRKHAERTRNRTNDSKDSNDDEEK